MIALYKDEASGSYGLYDTDMTSLGSCERIADPQEYQCGDVLSADTGMETFRCKYSWPTLMLRYQCKS